MVVLVAVIVVFRPRIGPFLREGEGRGGGKNMDVHLTKGRWTINPRLFVHFFFFFVSHGIMILAFDTCGNFLLDLTSKNVT